jgi:hypothetical protein
MTTAYLPTFKTLPLTLSIGGFSPLNFLCAFAPLRETNTTSSEAELAGEDVKTLSLAKAQRRKGNSRATSLKAGRYGRQQGL